LQQKLKDVEKERNRLQKRVEHLEKEDSPSDDAARTHDSFKVCYCMLRWSRGFRVFTAVLLRSQVLCDATLLFGAQFVMLQSTTVRSLSVSGSPSVIALLYGCFALKMKAL
jgi:hypothetical protein